MTGESVNTEYKVAIPRDSSKYMKTVVAFANCQGGRIVFGVDDKTLEVVGMDKDLVFQQMDAIANAISDSCEPSIIPDVTLQTVGDKTVIVVEISPGKMRPYYIKSKGIAGGTYIRSAGTTRPASDYMVKELILEGQNRSYDSEICSYLQVTPEDIARFCAQMKETAMRNTPQEEDRRKIRDVTQNVLISWGILAERDGVVLPTNAYALLTGQARPNPVIQCAIFKGTDRAFFVDRREYGGPIQEQAEAAFEYVLEKINLGMQTSGIYRQDVYELPVGSVREVIANSVAHRSYLESGNIQVALYDDRLEVTSPGLLLNGVSVQKMREGYSKPRNRAIASAFSYMRIIENWGTGIPRMFRECAEYGLPEPELIDMDGDFRVNIYRRRSGVVGDADDTNDTNRDTDDTKNDTNDTNRDTDDTKNDTNDTNRNTDDTKDDTNRDTDDTKDDTNRDTNDTNLDVGDAEPDANVGVSEKEARALELIREDPSVTQEEMKERLNVSIATVKRLIADLQKRGVVERQGSSRKGRWEIVRKEPANGLSGRRDDASETLGGGEDGMKNVAKTMDKGK